MPQKVFLYSSLNVTQILALWGAILSSIAFGWNLYRDLDDRAKLKVSAGLKRFVTGEDGRAFAVKHDLPVEGATSQAFIVISVTNIGRRPAMVNGWGGRYSKPVRKKSGFAIVARGLPKMLKEGESHIEYTHEFSIADENVKSLYLWDSTGREWRLPRKELAILREEVRMIQSEPEDK